jgi:hypothetical protein
MCEKTRKIGVKHGSMGVFHVSHATCTEKAHVFCLWQRAHGEEEKESILLGNFSSK